MMISKKMEKAINDQIAAELESEYIYLAMAYKFEDMNLPIFAKWFYKQAEEEHEHAMKFGKYLIDQGASVEVKAIAAPKAIWKSALDICKAAVEHEKYITKRIHDLVSIAMGEKDYATNSFLNWYVDEQVEEVATTTELMEMVKLADKPGQLLQLEGRVYRMVEARG